MARELIEKDRTIPSAAASYDLAAQTVRIIHSHGSHLRLPISEATCPTL